MNTKGIWRGLLMAGLLAWSGAAAASATIASIETFMFETEGLWGEIRAVNPIYVDLPKPGVVICRHKESGLDVLPDIPFQSLLMPEWLLRPGQSRQGIFWGPTEANPAKWGPLPEKPEVRAEGQSVVFRFTRAQTRDWNMDIVFRYTPGPDWIDLVCEILPGTDINGFEFLFASYITNAMDATWLPQATGSGEEWKLLDNRRFPGFGYQIAGNDAGWAYLHDGRWKGTPEVDRGDVLLPEWRFARPILVALQSSTGLAVVTLVDPSVCSVLPTQHHRTETAHDFTLYGDLKAGTPFVGKARVVIRKIGTFPEAAKAVDAMWAEFLQSCKRP